MIILVQKTQNKKFLKKINNKVKNGLASVDPWLIKII